MSSERVETVYKVVPVHLIKLEDGTILKRGTLETYVRGEMAFEVLHSVLANAAEGATIEELLAGFGQEDRSVVDQILHQLIARRLMIRANDTGGFETGSETAENIFYWEFGQDAESVRARLREVRIAIIGVNEIARELAQCLSVSGFEDPLVVDCDRLRSRRFYLDDGGLDVDSWTGAVPISESEWERQEQHRNTECVVATSDHGGLHWLRRWNARGVARRQHFFPVTMQNLTGCVGPYVIPGETACFECVRARQNSNLSRPDHQRAAEKVAFECQDVLGYHPLMPRVVAHAAAMELVKFWSRALPFAQAGSLIEIDLLTPRLTTRKVLRIPSCPVCGGLYRHAPTSASPSESMMPAH
jgi:bacteriocin biosynthesis cyclodehydratase domain-containing protein